MSVDAEERSKVRLDPVWVDYFRAKDEQCRTIGERLLEKLSESVPQPPQDEERDVVSEVSLETGEDIGDVHHALIVLATRGEIVRSNGRFVPAKETNTTK